jgi:hypothetical protein
MQGVHVVELGAPVAALYVPVPHDWHTFMPSSSLYVPPGHGLHSTTPTAPA